MSKKKPNFWSIREIKNELEEVKEKIDKEEEKDDRVARVFKIAFGILSLWLATRRTVAVLTVFGGLFGGVISGVAVYMAYKQNALVEIQNDRIQMQSHLMESERRSAMILMLDNVMTAIDEELRSKEYQEDSLLSDALIARIGALSHSFRPYYTMEDSRLSSRRYSYERGMLFNTLFSRGYLSQESMTSLAQTCSFRYSKLRDVQFSGLELFVWDDCCPLQLGNSFWENVRFEECNLGFGCIDSEFLQCHFNGGRYDLMTHGNLDMNFCEFQSCQLRTSTAGEFNLSECNINEVNLILNESRGSTHTIRVDRSFVNLDSLFFENLYPSDDDGGYTFNGVFEYRYDQPESELLITNSIIQNGFEVFLDGEGLTYQIDTNITISNCILVPSSNPYSIDWGLQFYSRLFQMGIIENCYIRREDVKNVEERSKENHHKQLSFSEFTEADEKAFYCGAANRYSRADVRDFVIINIKPAQFKLSESE